MGPRSSFFHTVREETLELPTCTSFFIIMKRSASSIVSWPGRRVFFGARGGQGTPPSNHCKRTNTLGGQATRGRNPCHWHPGRVGTRGMIGADELLCFFVCAKKRMVHSPTYRQTQYVRGDRTPKKRTLKKNYIYIVQKTTSGREGGGVVLFPVLRMTH